MVKLRRKAMNRDSIVSMEPTNTLQGIGLSLFNNTTPTNLYNPQDNPFPKYLTLLCRIRAYFGDRKIFC